MRLGGEVSEGALPDERHEKLIAAIGVRRFDLTVLNVLIRRCAVELTIIRGQSVVEAVVYTEASV